MKKLSRILSLALILSMVFVMAGCFVEDQPQTKEYTVTFETNGGSKIEAVKVEEGKELLLPVPTKAGFNFNGWYLDANFEEELGPNYIVKSDLTIYAKWDQKEANIKTLVSSVSNRSDFVLFGENKKEKENKRTEFFDLTQQYVVGDDNAWVVKPLVEFIVYDYDNEEVIDDQPDVDVWQFDIKVEVYDAATETYSDGSEYVEAVDSENCTVDFKQDALGFTFRVSVVPQGLTDKQLANIADYTTTFECKVIDGYNVYTGLELAYLENRTSGGDADAWKAFKAEKGLKVDYAPSALVLHTNIELTAADMPGYYFYTKEEVAGASDATRAEGSLKDYYNVYLRNMEEDQNFSIEGNYFTLNTQKVREVVRENGNITPEGQVISHATLFRFEGAQSGKVELNNANLVGNAPRAENAVLAGGVIFTKIEGPDFKSYNTISSAWFISYMPNYTHSKVELIKCKSYDAYNCFVYNWGSENVHIIDSEMIGAGGPVIIQDHVRPTSDNRIAKTYVVNSKLESYVAGTEGWFYGVGATALVPQIKGLDAVFTPFGRSILKANQDKSITFFNFICVNKSGSAEGLTAEKIQGELKIDDNASFDFGATNPYLAAMLDMTFTMGAPAFQSSKGGFGYFNSGIFDIQNQQIVDPTNAIYQGEYMCIYFNGMALTLGYNSFNGGYELYQG